MFLSVMCKRESFLYKSNKKSNFFKKVFLFIISVLLCSSMVFGKEVKKSQYETLIKNGSESKIKKALEKKLNPNARVNENEETLLMCALRYNRDDSIINLLFSSGASARAKNKDGQNVFMYACIYSTDEKIISHILEKSFTKETIITDINDRDLKGKSALTYIKECDNQTALDVVKGFIGIPEGYTEDKDYLDFLSELNKNAVLLQSNNADDVENPSEENTALPQEQNEPTTENADSKETLQKETVNIEENKTETQIDENAEHAPEAAEEETPVPSAEQDSSKPDTLEEAKSKEKEEINVPASKPIDSKNYDKVSLFDFALEDEIPETVPEVEEDAFIKIENPDKTDKNGRTQLMQAAKDGDEKKLENLIKSGADVNLTDKDGWTALMYAVRYQKNTKITRMLLQAGSDTKKKNSYSYDVFQIASIYAENLDILKTLIEYSKINADEMFKAFIMAITSNENDEEIKTEKVKFFISKKLPINRFYEGRTPLMYAAQFSSSTKVIQVLLENGASKKFYSTDGKTVFDYAESNKLLQHDEIYWSLNQR